MSVPSESNGRPSAPEDVSGVLSNLPRTRPQRSTPRRSAARKATAAAAATPSAPTAADGREATATPRKAKSTPKATSTPKAASAPRGKSTRKAPSKARARSAPKRASAPPPITETVPMQGFESESDRARGPVHPPGGAEIVASAVEIIGELAKSGLTTGERLLKDVFARLPLP